MFSHRILLVYGTSYGHTAKIADRLREILARDGYDVLVTTAEHPSAEADPARFDAIIAGGSVIGGHHQRALERWVTANSEALRRVPSAFFSVSGSAASKERRGQLDARRCLDDFLRKTGWNPDLSGTFGGAMAFTRYSWFLRFVMKQISRRAGGPTDTSRDHDLTNWHQVEEFGHDFATLIRMGEPAPASPALPG